MDVWRAVLHQPLESVLALSEPPVNSGGYTPEPSIQTKHLAAFAEMQRRHYRRALFGLSVEARILLDSTVPGLHRPWRFWLDLPELPVTRKVLLAPAPQAAGPSRAGRHGIP
ncbi:unnamed protein product [Pipistrellus nathusii]|uniref:Uncharacterized protein n=1 Tax=Pipistrellus nathusii TaxID=59473 RepID=A0ABN9ZN55_PIPNA